MKPASRRDLLLMMAAAGALPAWGGEQRKLLPVNTPGIDHLDTVVPDVEKSARHRSSSIQVRRSYS